MVPVYGLEQPEEKEPSEAAVKKLDKELKQGPAKTDLPETLAQYELSGYPSESKPLKRVGLSPGRMKLGIRAARGKLRPGGNMQPAKLFNLAANTNVFYTSHDTFFPPIHLLLLQLFCHIIEPTVAHLSKSFLLPL